MHTSSTIPNTHFKRHQLIYVACFLIMLITRVYACFFSGLPNIHQDTPDYFGQADTLLAGGYTNYFPNGLPAIIALVKFIVPNHAYTGMLVANILMAMGTGWFVYHITKHVFKSSSIALVALALLAIFPTQINLSRWLTSEVAATFFLTGGFYFYFKQRFVFAGMMMSMSTFIRTEMMFIFGLMVMFDLVIKKRFLLKYIIGFVLPLLIVGFYCKMHTGKFALSGHSTVNILYSLTASGENIDWAIVERYPEDFPASEAAKLYFQRMKEEPGPFWRDRWENFREMWLFPSDAKGTRSPKEQWMIFLGNILLLFGGIFTIIRQRKNLDAWVLTFPFIIITGLHIMMMALQRYIFPVEPFMIMLTGYALWMIYAKLTKKNLDSCITY